MAAGPSGVTCSLVPVTPLVPGPWRTRQFAELNRDLAEIVGDKTAAALAGLRVRSAGDLLRLVPRRYLSGTETSDLSELVEGEDVAIVAKVHDTRMAGQEPRRRLEVVLTDDRTTITATFFGRERYISSWSRQLTRGARAIFVGRVGSFSGHLQLAHPDFVLVDEFGTVTGHRARTHRAMADQVSRDGLIGLYPATAKLPTWNVAETVELVLDHVGRLDDPLPEWVRSSRGLVDEDAAYRGVHRPATRREASAGLDRLRFDEALALQLVMARRRQRSAGDVAPRLTGTPGGILDQFDDRLPFRLTDGQLEVCDEILDELARPHPMRRLLQGEVGSGKTVVAVRAMLRAIDSGRQAALVAPTEVLASQHFGAIRALLGDLGDGQVLGAPEGATEVVLLTGSLGAAAATGVRDAIASGRAGLVIGTHALFSASVRFADLGLVIVDEQHRFGVRQRASLGRRPDGSSAHQLVMTATPIPRSIAMTAFGDLATSILTEIPAGRSDVQTTVVEIAAHPGWLERAWERIREEVAAGRQAFIVCPRIDPGDPLPSDGAGDDGAGDDGPTEAEAAPMASAIETYERLSAGPLHGLRMGLLHGRLSGDEKDAVMAAFASGGIDVVVSTTVIEVGVDVPNASVMVVLDADRFGVSQLHQLRGRIGRGAHPGLCLLVTSSTSGTALSRLAAVAATRDGFRLAEIDLLQRREGNVLGSAQAGTKSSLRLVRVIDDAGLIADAREVAERLVRDDPDERHDLLADLVTQTERQGEEAAAGEWLERT